MIMNLSNSVQIDNTSQLNQERKYSESLGMKHTRQQPERFPQISEKILDEAIKKEILPPHYKDKLITNPNKYSVFFAKFDLNSQTMKEALMNLNLSPEDAKTLSYYEFSSQSFNTLHNVTSYLFYMTEHYQQLKAIVNECNRIKREKENQQRQKQNNIFYTQLGYESDHANEFDDSSPQWMQQNTKSKSSHNNNNTSKISNNGSRMNKSIGELLEKSRTLKSFEEKKTNQKQKYGKYDEVIGFVRNQKISNLSDQRRYEDIQIPDIEKKILDRSLKIQKEVEKKAKELREKLKRAQEKVKVRLEKQEMLLEKRLIEIDATGEKYEEQKKKKEEQRQLEIIKLREIKQKKAEEIQKKREMKEQVEYQKRHQLNQLIEKKENNAEGVMRRIKSEHDKKFQTLNMKYDDIMLNSHSLKENGEFHHIQKMCENQEKRIQKTEGKDKALLQHIKQKQIEYKKRIEKFEKFIGQNETRNENKLDKLKIKLENKFGRIEKVINMNHQKSQTLNTHNTTRHNKVQSNFANEIYKYSLKQDRILKKHTQIDQRNNQHTLSSSDFFNLNRSLTSDLFQKRDIQFDGIK